MTDPNPAEADLERRVTALENEVAHLRDDVARTASDAGAARVLASGADREVSEVRAQLRAHLAALNALRQTQLDMAAEMDRRFTLVDVRFAHVEGQLAEVKDGLGLITGMLQTLIDREAS